MMKIAATSSLAVAALLLSACGSGDDKDDDVTISTKDGKVSFDADDNGSVSITANDGTAQLRTGENAGDEGLPKGFTAYPGASIKLSLDGAQAGGKGGMLAMETEDSPEKVIAFYKDQIEDAGLAIHTQGTFSGASTIGAKDEDTGLGVNVIANGGEGMTQVQIAYGIGN